MALEPQTDYNAIVLKAFSALGRSTSRALVYHLDVGYGIRIVAGESPVSMEKLEAALVQMLGVGGAILADMVRRELDSQILG